jgi:glycosyltransferase involved in cell wall biosynthesis
LVGKKIILAANSDLSFDQRMQRICQTLDQAGYHVFILGRCFPKSIELANENYQQERISLWFQKGKLAYIELNFRIFFNLLFQKTDAFYSVDLDTLLACWWLAKLKGKKLIHDAHEFMEEVPEVYNRPITKKIWRWIGKSFVPGTDLAFTTSQTIGVELEKIHHKKYGLVRNIAHLTEIETHENRPKETGFWVFLGAVNQGRGIEEFLEILPYTNRKLVILGDGDRMEAIQKLVSDKSIEHLVEFRGKVKPAEARKIMINAWAGINLLTDEGLSYRYSLANKFFDYVHAGIPQICINFPEYKLLMNDFEVGVLSSLQKDSILAATQIISLPEKQLLYRQQTQMAKKVWNWQSESKKLLELVEMVF